MIGDMKCGTCVFGHFPADQATGARRWAGVCGNHLPEGMTGEEMKRKGLLPTHYVEQHWKCSNGRYLARVRHEETALGSTEPEGDSGGVQQAEV